MRRPRAIALMFALMLAALCPVRSPAQGQTGVASATSSVRLAEVENPPVTAEVTAEKRKRVITIVGRKDDSLIFTESDTGVGTRLALDTKRMTSTWFDFKYDRADVYLLVRQRSWNKAVKLLLPVIKPTFPYLDLIGNNAVEPAFDLANYMMKGAEKRRLLANDDEAQLALVKKQYASAYAVYKYIENAAWSPLAEMAALKRVQCLLELEKPKTAARLFEGLQDPQVGDRAYGLYWLLAARIHVEHGRFTEAMDASVKSVCFETKDIETFPDALLVSAQCYEELQNWYRARDVYYEVARIFPKTEWAELAQRRLRFIVKQGFTTEDETAAIETVFFGLNEDMNEMVDNLLSRQDAGGDAPAVEPVEEEIEIDLETAE